MREREGGAAEAVGAVSEIDQQQRRITGVGAQHRHEAQAYVLDRRERGDDERYRRDHLVGARAVAPGGGHGQRVLPHRDRDAQRGAELHRHRLHRIEQVRILARLPAGGHPVRRQHHPIDARHIRRGDVRERFGHRHPGRRPRVEQRDRGTLSHRHRLAGEAAKAAQRYRAVGHRHLPRPHHLVAGHEPADAAVADGDEEGLVRHRRHAQHPLQGRADVDPAGVEPSPHRRHAHRVAMHPREVAEQDGHRHGDRDRIERRVVDPEEPAPGRLSHVRPRTALALAQRGEVGDPARVDGQDVAFLGFVAPDLERRHRGVVAGDGAQLEPSAASGAVHQLGQGVGQPSRPDVVDGEDGVVRAELPAAIDDLLAAALHLGVPALHGGEVERLVAAPRFTGGRGPAAEADEHRRPAEHDDAGARRDGGLPDLVRADVADPARDHDGLVVAVDPPGAPGDRAA